MKDYGDKIIKLTVIRIHHFPEGKWSHLIVTEDQDKNLYVFFADGDRVKIGSTIAPLHGTFQNKTLWNVNGNEYRSFVEADVKVTHPDGEVTYTRLHSGMFHKTSIEHEIFTRWLDMAEDTAV